ncbi:hypothetical protein Acr_16g0001250 [Actinidia rufa]|uniref:Uncharacterized protein n=1 Tax=Actinidia rufa TaxID=165716 RepID=A0A7J0FXT0_9ERIC|nr:hypothetical protein Acr_16g0001250 [Actinidia rufa]
MPKGRVIGANVTIKANQGKTRKASTSMGMAVTRDGLAVAEQSHGGLITEYVNEALGEQDPECTPSVRQNVSVEEVEEKQLDDELFTASQSVEVKDSVGTHGICQEANKKEGRTLNDTTGSVDVKKRGFSSQVATYVSFFENNRHPSLGNQLEQIEMGDGPIPIEAEEIQGTWNPWKHYLVGYFGGKFPGKMALNRIVAAWKVPVKVHHHNSGWIMFQFESVEQNQTDPIKEKTKIGKDWETNWTLQGNPPKGLAEGGRSNVMNGVPEDQSQIIKWNFKFWIVRSKSFTVGQFARFNEMLNDPWLLLGDFNNVLNIDERSNGHRLRKLNKQHFSHISSRAAVAEDKLYDLHQRLHDNPVNVILQEQIVKVKQAAFNLDEAESSSCSGIDNFVLLNGKLVDDDQATKLMCAITNKEIKEGLFSIGDDKAPGPDGYSDHFFKKAWSIVETDFCAAIKEFFASEGRFPFRYLGLPMASTKLTIAQYHPFTDRILGLPIPTGIRERLTRMCRNFLWGGKCLVSKKALVAWDSICLPKMEGGLVFKNLEAWNLALLAKNLWNIQDKKDSLWVRWVHQYYLQNTLIWEYTRKKQDSAMLKKVLLIRDKIYAMEGSMQAVNNRMGQWVLRGRFYSKLAYEYFRPRRGIITWPKVDAASLRCLFNGCDRFFSAAVVFGAAKVQVCLPLFKGGLVMAVQVVVSMLDFSADVAHCWGGVCLCSSSDCC